MNLLFIILYELATEDLYPKYNYFKMLIYGFGLQFNYAL